jgi:hypothetical protein
MADHQSDIVNRLRRISEAWREQLGLGDKASFELKGPGLLQMTKLLEATQEEIIRLRDRVAELEGKSP